MSEFVIDFMTSIALLTIEQRDVVIDLMDYMLKINDLTEEQIEKVRNATKHGLIIAFDGGNALFKTDDVNPV